MYGYMNISGAVVIPCQCEYAYDFFDGFARVGDKNNKGLIDTKGNVVVLIEYSYANYGEGVFTLLKTGKITILDEKMKRLN